MSEYKSMILVDTSVAWDDQDATALSLKGYKLAEDLNPKQFPQQWKLHEEKAIDLSIPSISAGMMKAYVSTMYFSSAELFDKFTKGTSTLEISDPLRAGKTYSSKVVFDTSMFGVSTKAEENKKKPYYRKGRWE